VSCTPLAHVYNDAIATLPRDHHAIIAMSSRERRGQYV